MRVFRFEKSQVLHVSLDEAWAFFSDPRNLAKITPPDLNLAPTSDVPDTMHPGMIVTYRVKILPGFAMTWVTEISHVDAPHFFVDEQRFGPYKFWHHLHRFTACADGVITEDVIHYGLYGGPLSMPMNALMVRRQLEHIFAYRQQVLTGMFSHMDQTSGIRTSKTLPPD